MVEEQASSGKVKLDGSRAVMHLQASDFGQEIDWDGELRETFLYVELPFWLMVDPCSVPIDYEGCSFSVHEAYAKAW